MKSLNTSVIVDCPAKQYKDSRRKSGFMNRSCRRDWLEKWSFLCYSKSCDEVFCLAYVLFPDSSDQMAK